MSHQRIERNRMTRRDFLWLIGVAGSAAALPPLLLAGCATDPVTGKKTLVGLTEAQEIGLDKEQSPHQFSADYGAYRDDGLNRYVQDVSSGLWRNSHRPAMPYSARVLNANYINAYTFPGGSMATTRGILLELQNEDELAALMGHETGHVNARHAAERAGKSMLVQGGLVLASIAVADKEQYQPIVNLVGQIGGSALLAKYSRDNEREADALGMEYMARAGYNPDGMVGLMDVLRSQSRSKPGLLETMFASHPMSDERYETAVRRAENKYAGQRGKGVQRQRYMDHTADLRRLKPAVTAMQQGEGLMAKERLPQAEERFASALSLAPDDYVANMLMAKVKLAQKRPREAEAYLAQARAIQPGEGQAQQMSGIVQLALNQPDAALQFFNSYDRLLPGNPNTGFLKGVAYENMRDRKQAAQHYYRYAQEVGGGKEAQYATSRLKAWGYLK
jgi:predicted Zn-dependent protease